MKRLVLISDTHTFTPALPDGDILLHAGDLTFRGTEDELVGAFEWLGAQMHSHVIAIPGNHDWDLQRRPDYWVRYTRLVHQIHLLIDTAVTAGGFRVFGCPWSPWFCDWAFGHRPDVARNYWSAEGIPTDAMSADIWLVHGPPKGLGDKCRDGNVGCPSLLSAIDREMPRLVVGGHIHEGGGRMTLYGRTLVVNASVLDGEYKMKPEPIITLDME